MIKGNKKAHVAQKSVGFEKIAKLIKTESNKKSHNGVSTQTRESRKNNLKVLKLC